MRGVASVVAAASVAYLGGCGFFKPPVVSPKPEGSPRAERAFKKAPAAASKAEQDAVFAFLDGDKQRFKVAYDALPPDAQPSAVGKFLREYADATEKTDVAAASVDFKTAVGDYVKACRATATAVGRIPDGAFPGGKFRAGFDGLLKGNGDAGEPLGGDVVDGVQGIARAFGKLYDLAPTAGIEVER